MSHSELNFPVLVRKGLHRGGLQLRRLHLGSLLHILCCVWTFMLLPVPNAMYVCSSL